MTEQTKIEVDIKDYPHEFNKAYLTVEVKAVLYLLWCSVYMKEIVQTIIL